MMIYYKVEVAVKLPLKFYIRPIITSKRRFYSYELGFIQRNIE